MIQTARRWRHIARGQLQRLLLERPQLAVVAGSAALTTLASLDDLPTEVFKAIEPCLPSGRSVELDIGVAAIARRLARDRLLDAADDSERAKIHYDVGLRLFKAGMYHDAYAEMKNAVDIRRRLVAADEATPKPRAAAQPKSNQERTMVDVCTPIMPRSLRPVFDPQVIQKHDLAVALVKLALIGGRLGWLDNSLALTIEGVEIHRRLAKRDLYSTLTWQWLEQPRSSPSALPRA